MSVAKAGDVIENYITGEKIVFRKTASDTNGEYLEIELFVRPGGAVAAEHIHLEQDEFFEVLSGTILLSVKGEKTTGTTGFKHTVKAGTPHIWVNDGEDELHCRLIFTPANQMEQFFEVLFGLVRDGKSNDKGLPNILHLSILGLEHNMWLQCPPIPVQRTLFKCLKPIGTLLGYEKQHTKYKTF
jgi:quercetin dioxygenase-like cupin family protein